MRLPIKHVAKLDLVVSLSILNFAILAMGPEKLLQMLKNYYQETSLPLFKERKKVFSCLAEYLIVVNKVIKAVSSV